MAGVQPMLPVVLGMLTRVLRPYDKRIAHAFWTSADSLRLDRTFSVIILIYPATFKGCTSTQC